MTRRGRNSNDSVLDSGLPHTPQVATYPAGMPELGLFPLPIVLLPTERVPLHIFEPRYRELIDECLETGGEFGLLFATDEGAVHEIGTRATVEEVLDELDDGRLNIIVEGRERFRLLELTSGRSFTTGLVEDVSTTRTSRTSRPT